MPYNAAAKVQVGSHVTFQKNVTEQDISSFAEATGDVNPLHLDATFASGTVFGQRIAHGILSVGFISAALTRLPGLVVYLSQNVSFLRPVKIGDTITADAEVLDRSPEKGIIRLRTTCLNQNGETVIEGEARVKLYDLPAA